MKDWRITHFKIAHIFRGIIFNQLIGNPLKRFNDSLASTPPRAIERFYCDNFVDLMGEGLAADLRHPMPRAAA